ncbi:Os02g0186300 [Oryza sativa Japonica Group]|uniref:Uncharacterized protein n=3 Tax=Oryza TaxID=4527 RepID=A0A8J8Y4T4_ORYSJ|nr:hypothetical protein OsJ_05666 [Oryza sativa Japonica Group]BAS77353.1 Os02g0186300 [Oryza sativa Japonica Group]
MSELMKNPRVMRKVQAELRDKLAGKPRVTEDDLSDLKDPNYWDDAEVFRLERFANSTIDFKGMDMEFIPFGAGRRMCSGLAFAEAIIDLLFSTLLFHFDWELPCGMTASELDMIEEMALTVRRKNDLHLRPILRVPQTQTSSALLFCERAQTSSVFLF